LEGEELVSKVGDGWAGRAVTNKLRKKSRGCDRPGIIGRRIFSDPPAGGGGGGDCLDGEEEKPFVLGGGLL
jgi:hypothetical protein